MSARSPAPRAKGFTLVELMIVVVIIAILAAIAIPAIQGRTGPGYDMVCRRDGSTRVMAHDNVWFDVQDGIWIGGRDGPGYRPAEGEVCWSQRAVTP